MALIAFSFSSHNANQHRNRFLSIFWFSTIDAVQFSKNHQRMHTSFNMKVFYAAVAAAHLVLADDETFSPATGVFTCSSNWGDSLLLNDQAVQNCHIVIDGFAQNVMDSVGSVLFSSGRPNATLSLACMDDTDTAIQGDTFCICELINSLGEGCEEGTWKSGNYGGSSPPVAQKWPSVEHWKTIYAPATGKYTCSAVVGNVCTMNPQASRTCDLFIDGFSYQRDSDWGVRLVSAIPYATVSVSCTGVDELFDPRTSIQCENSCVCEPILNGEGCNDFGGMSAGAALQRRPLGLLFSFGIALTAWLA